MNNLIDNEVYEQNISLLQKQIREASAAYQDPLRDCVSKFFGIWNTGSNQIDASKFFES